MKPLGIEIGGARGNIMRVTHPTTAQDAIWNAVQEARAAGMTPAQFISEAREAWEQEGRDALKHDLAAFRREV